MRARIGVGTSKPRPGGPYGVPLLPTCAFHYMVPNQAAVIPDDYDGDWKPYSDLRIGPMVIGAGLEMWIAYLRQRGYSSSDWVFDNGNAGYPSWRPQGEAIIDWLAGHKLVILADLPPADLLQEIKRRSTVGTRIWLGFMNFESVGQVQERRTDMRGMRDAAKLNLLRSAGINANTEMSYIDKFERLDSPPTPPAGNYLGSHSDANPPGDDVVNEANSAKHTWEVRVDSPGFPFLWRDALEVALLNNYGSAAGLLVDGVLIDNVNQDGPYFGTATNTPTPAYGHGEYRAGSREMLDELHDMAWGAFGLGVTQHNERLVVAGNGGWSATGIQTVTFTFDHLPARYGEFYMQANGNPSENGAKTIAQIRADLELHATALLASPDRYVLWNQLLRVPAANIHLPSQWTDGDCWALKAGGPGIRGGVEIGTWRNVREVCAKLGVTERVIVMNSRGSSGFPAFWDENFVRPLSRNSLTLQMG